MIIKTGIISKIAFTIFNINIYWYAVLIALAFVMALIISYKKRGQFGIEYETITDLIILVIPLSIISARLYYIIFNLSYYLEYPMQILDTRNGGLAIYGGIIGGAITIYFYCKTKQINFWDLLDFSVPMLALGQAIGRIGNYINIEAYGAQSNCWLKMEVIENGVTKYVHPTFLYEMVVTLGLFIFLSFLAKNRKFKGELTYIYIIVYSFARIFIEYLRTDSLMVKNYKISLILSIVFFIVFSVIMGYQFYKSKSLSKNVEKGQKM